MYYSRKTAIGNKYKLNYIKGLARENTFVQGYTRVEEGAAKLREDILTLLDISKRDVFFDPELGCDLDKYLFEINDFVLRDSIVSYLTEELKKQIPEIQLRFIDVVQDYDNNLVEIYLEYNIISLGVIDTLKVTKYIRERLDFS